MSQVQPTNEPVIERRRSPRESKRTSAWVSAATGSKGSNGFNVSLRDLSLHGVGFVADRPMTLKAAHWMVVADKSLRLSTRFRVVNVVERKDGKWDVGGEFF